VITGAPGFCFDFSSKEAFIESPPALQIALNRYSDDEHTTIISI
jgi:hypothetical protein